jgi:hypothetical protein
VIEAHPSISLFPHHATAQIKESERYVYLFKPPAGEKVAAGFEARFNTGIPFP